MARFLYSFEGAKNSLLSRYEEQLHTGAAASGEIPCLHKPAPVFVKQVGFVIADLYGIPDSEPAYLRRCGTADLVQTVNPVDSSVLPSDFPWKDVSVFVYIKSDIDIDFPKSHFLITSLVRDSAENLSRIDFPVDRKKRLCYILRS